MKTEWDYSELAEVYLKRPDYSPEVIDAILRIAQLKEGDEACDVGAGVAHLTLALLSRRLRVTAVEPNYEMRLRGSARTAHLRNVEWFEGTAEETLRPAGQFAVVTFGSSFNVVDRPAALRESARLLRPHGWFVCLWNHRNLDDPIQKQIEEIISSEVKGYSYGVRREDQSKTIIASKLFSSPLRVEGDITHTMSRADVLEAWRSHATLQRQAGAAFSKVLASIERFLGSLDSDRMVVPYTTRAWMSQRIGGQG